MVHDSGRMSQPAALDPLLTEDEVASILKRSPRTVRKDRSRGKGPSFLRLGRLVRYRRADVEAYLSRHQVTTDTHR